MSTECEPSGTLLNVTFDNTRQTTNSERTDYSPLLQSNFRAEVTQHLLQGFGWGINGRFIVQAKNDRRITDSAFREQLLYTVNQVEDIYWGLVSAYEDEQAKERALAQSSQLTEDNRKQLQIGTLAPLDVVNTEAEVASASAWGTGTVRVRGADRLVSVFRHGDYTVWGLTERVLRQLLAYAGEPVVGRSFDDDSPPPAP